MLSHDVFGRLSLEDIPMQWLEHLGKYCAEFLPMQWLSQENNMEYYFFLTYAMLSGASRKTLSKVLPVQCWR